MSFELIVQEMIYDRLSADLALQSLGAPVYDGVPQSTPYPYVTIGEDLHVEWDTDTSLGTDCSLSIHTWSRHRGRRETKQMQAAIYDSLHRAELVYSGYNVVLCDFVNSQSFLDSDGLTRHGVQTFRIITEKEV
jgi:hypothetical protein